MEFTDLRVWGEAKELGYIERSFAEEMIEGFDRVRKMLNAMITSVNRCHESRTK